MLWSDHVSGYSTAFASRQRREEAFRECQVSVVWTLRLAEHYMPDRNDVVEVNISRKKIVIWVSAVAKLQVVIFIRKSES